MSAIIAGQQSRITPEKFQRDLIRNISAHLLTQMPLPVLLQAPTGGGKTFILGKVLETVSQASPTVWFWFVPFVTLVQQTEDSIASHSATLLPVSMEQGRNQEPRNAVVILSTAAAVAKARSRTQGYADGDDDTTRNLAAYLALARSRGLKIGLVVDEAHIGLDAQTEFGKFVQFVAPDRLLMVTATPKDKKLLDFLAAAGYTANERFVVDRQSVVDARLNKRYIEAVVYDVRQSLSSVTDLEQTVLKQAWRRNLHIRQRCEELGIGITPLLLVQVANGSGTVEACRDRLMRLCGVPAHAIGTHSSDEPNPVLMASIANDTTKEVLIFKQSAGTGFDAPRAFVLASTKPVNDPDFAHQFIGRIMRVHQGMRAKFPRPTKFPVELDTAYVYLANAEAQTGFEQAVAATSGLHANLEGMTEKLVARRTISGALVYTNRPTDELPLLHDAGYDQVATGQCPASTKPLPVQSIGQTANLWEQATGDDLLPPQQGQTVDLPVLDVIAQPARTVQRPKQKNPMSAEEFTSAMLDAGLRLYPLRTLGQPHALSSEERPEMADMSKASRAAATRLNLSSATTQLAIAVATDTVKEQELHTELTTGQKTRQSVKVVIDRHQIAKEARARMNELPQVEDEDRRVIVDVLSARMRAPIEEAHTGDDPLTLDQIKRMSRDAAHAIIRKEWEALAELLHEEIGQQARLVSAGPLPAAMVFASERPLASSEKNIYGVMPPSKDDLSALPQLLVIDQKQLMDEREVDLDGGKMLIAPFDGSSALGVDETAFAKALDRTEFVKWWHRNPDRKKHSVRLVRGEHKNYFYPDFLVCLEHFPGDKPIQRLVETKENVKDAVRKARRPSPFYGKVLFMTKDAAKWKWVNEDGTLGEVIDLEDLENLREWLRQNVPMH